MKYDILLDLVTELGYNLAMSGAETFRVEESVNRILSAYGIESEVFAITNCMTVSIKTPDGKAITRMKRIGFHGNDIDGVERFSNLSRRICAEIPEISVAKQWWLKVNTKAVRNGALDGALFPHIIHFTYHVHGQTYTGKRYVNWNKRCPVKDEHITVHYEEASPEKYAVII